MPTYYGFLTNSYQGRARMADTIVKFSSSDSCIGLIVRGKLSAQHHPGAMAQHADVILADGSPVGFYGEGNGGNSNSVGLGMQGVVYDHAALRIQRPYYIDVSSAVSNRVVSTVLLVKVTSDQANKFAKSWASMTTDPGNFNILGGNCSTHASASFIDAGLLKRGIPGLDTPDNLYAQLVKELPATSLQSLSGYIGFQVEPGGGFSLALKPYIDTVSVNRPNPGKSGALSVKSSV